MLLKKARRKGFRGCIHSTSDRDILTQGVELRDAGMGNSKTSKTMCPSLLHVPNVAVSDIDPVRLHCPYSVPSVTSLESNNCKENLD